MRVFSTLGCVLLPILFVAVLFGGSSSPQVLAMDLEPDATALMDGYEQAINGLMRVSNEFFGSNRAQTVDDMRAEIGFLRPFFDGNFVQHIRFQSPAARTFSQHVETFENAMHAAAGKPQSRTRTEAVKSAIEEMSKLLEIEVNRALRLKRLRDQGPADDDKKKWLNALFIEHRALTTRMHREVERVDFNFRSLPQVRKGRVALDEAVRRNLVRARQFLTESREQAGAGSLPSSSAPV